MDEMQATGASHDERRAESCEGRSAEGGFEAMERLILRCSTLRRVLERIECGALSPVRLEYPIDLIVRESCKEVKKGV
jgi:hypothetical protein